MTRNIYRVFVGVCLSFSSACENEAEHDLKTIKPLVQRHFKSQLNSSDLMLLKSSEFRTERGKKAATECLLLFQNRVSTAKRARPMTDALHADDSRKAAEELQKRVEKMGTQLSRHNHLLQNCLDAVAALAKEAEKN